MQYSIIVPVFNGSATLEKLFLGIKKNLGSQNAIYEVIFVDDNSFDGSWEAICKLKSGFPENISGIKLSKNFGQHHATLCGIIHSKGSFVFTMDDDLEVHPEDLLALIEKQKQSHADLVYGTNKNISRISLRGVLRGVFTNTYRQISKLEGKNRGKGSSFRMLSRKLADKIKQHSGNFIFIDEFCLWHTENIVFAEVKHYPSAKKQSRYSLGKLLALTINLVLFSTLIPLRLMTYFGFTMAFINFLLGLWFIFKKIAYNVPLGYTSLIISILFTAGIILLCLGILGEYLGIVVRSTANMPSYSIEEKI